MVVVLCGVLINVVGLVISLDYRKTGCVDAGADGVIQLVSCTILYATARHHPHRTHDLRSGSQDHHPSKNSVQKTMCCNSTSNAPDDGRMRPKHVELRIHQ